MWKPSPCWAVQASNLIKQSATPYRRAPVLMNVTSSDNLLSSAYAPSSPFSGSHGFVSVFGVPKSSTRTFQSSATQLHTEDQAEFKTFSIDKKEVLKFSAIASSWWHPQGPFAPLHAMNPVRCDFIRQTAEYGKSIQEKESNSAAEARAGSVNVAEPLRGLRVLDVGCGGGILSESLARLGAEVTGIDVSEENIAVATLHSGEDPLIAGRVTYRCISAEQLSASGATFDMVIASEVIEHVRLPDQFVETLTRMLADRHSPLIISTINRTLPAWAVTIAGAEYITGIVPRGTHQWQKFITPEELSIMANQSGLRMALAAGMVMGLNGKFNLRDDLTVNYIASFLPAAAAQESVDEDDSAAAAPASQ